ncbi:hypothetical protein HPT27_02445 [Permianibacter sp. IMCC34836]|uniref:hypothetical protein n=1 Tax=Permianibacter fluminis TaxID=2738515 RepID=UPI00155591A3|nr:hypothetical protein [Permianibacter fluminis]NQD35864.1 hypothetical protein [Permianibacter fluminis]
MIPEERLPDMRLDTANLYKEEVYTDGRVGSIRVMTPVNTDGSFDMNRAVLYTGQTQLMTPGGALPLAFEIEAATLDEAIGKFADAAKQSLLQTMEEIQEMRRQQASSIVIPGQEPGGFGGMAGLGGAGGKIRMP